MQAKRKKYFSDPTIAIASTIIVALILIVGVYAMASDVTEEAWDFSKYPRQAIADYYHCHYCNTIVPCPLDHNGIKKNCPSCGLMMDIVSKSLAPARSGIRQNTNASGFVDQWGGRNGGYGLGPGGNLVCPGCGLVIPHQRGVPSFKVNCPKCGNKMRRQFPAYLPTAFFNNTTSNPGTQQSFNNNAPPITSNAVMTHGYRGVCSRCHQIVDLNNSQSGYTPVGGQLYPYCVNPMGSNRP